MGMRPLNPIFCFCCHHRKTLLRPALHVQPFTGRLRLLWALLTPAAPSRRLSTPVAHPLSGAGRQVSQGKTRDLRAIYLAHLRPHPPGDIGLLGSLARMRPPHMRFLFVRPALCLQLPSGPASRRRPCCSASDSHHQGPQRTCTSKSSAGHHPGLSVLTHRALPGAPKKGPGQAGRSYFATLGLLLNLLRSKSRR